MGFYLKESLRLQEIAEEDKRIKLAEKCLEWAFKEQDKKVAQLSEDDPKIVQFDIRGMLQRGPNQLRTKDKAERILKFLHDHGQARKIPTTKFGDVETKGAWEVRKFEDDQNIA